MITVSLYRTRHNYLAIKINYKYLSYKSFSQLMEEIEINRWTVSSSVKQLTTGAIFCYFDPPTKKVNGTNPMELIIST